MCHPGDGPDEVAVEARMMDDRDGVVERRVAPDRIDFGRWALDTLRMWPILLLVGGVAYRAETTRSDVDHIKKDFISQGPRVSTERDRPTTIEAELRSFKANLDDDFMNRELLGLKLKQILDRVENLSDDVSETNEIVKALQEASR
jgi:hypothetical protein